MHELWQVLARLLQTLRKEVQAHRTLGQFRPKENNDIRRGSMSRRKVLSVVTILTLASLLQAAVACLAMMAFYAPTLMSVMLLVVVLAKLDGNCAIWQL